jgi:Gas vesicle protein K/Gas vesicle protein
LTRLEAVKEEKQTSKRSSGKHKQKTECITEKVIPGTNVRTNSKESQNGIAKLILTIIKILTDLLERQAQRKVMEGKLADADIERLGLAFINIRQTLYHITRQFGFEYNELDIPIGSAGGRAYINKLEGKELLSASTLVDILDKLINKKTVIAGEIVISVAEIDLIVLNLLAMLSSKSESY